jgi:predicted lipoprotein with Yx(FWY)xxD motif
MMLAFHLVIAATVFSLLTPSSGSDERIRLLLTFEEEQQMLFFRRSLLLAGLLLTVFVAACGTTPNPSSTGTNNTMTSTNNTNNSNMGSTPTVSMTQNNPTPKPTQAGNMQGGNNAAFIHTIKVKIGMNMVTVLTDAKGMILYYKNDDPRPKSSCTGACAKDWPPVVANGMDMITSSMTLPHKLTVYMTGNGNQVLYDGHPLYTYAADMAPGQFTGRGQDNVWYLVGVGL